MKRTHKKIGRSVPLQYLVEFKLSDPIVSNSMYYDDFIIEMGYNNCDTAYGILKKIVESANNGEGNFSTKSKWATLVVEHIRERRSIGDFIPDSAYDDINRFRYMICDINEAKSISDKKEKSRVIVLILVKYQDFINLGSSVSLYHAKLLGNRVIKYTNNEEIFTI
jgi:hypothetical protein